MSPSLCDPSLHCVIRVVNSSPSNRPGTCVQDKREEGGGRREEGGRRREEGGGRRGEGGGRREMHVPNNHQSTKS